MEIRVIDCDAIVGFVDYGTIDSITIEPVFNDNTEGEKADSKPFKEVVKTHNWI